MEGKRIKFYAIAGTKHFGYFYAYSEGQARRNFHNLYNGESITHIYCEGRFLQGGGCMLMF